MNNPSKTPNFKPKDGWIELPEDLLTHIHDWRKACEIAMAAAPEPSIDQNDRKYWEHQLITLDRVEAMITERDKQALAASSIASIEEQELIAAPR